MSLRNRLPFFLFFISLLVAAPAMAIANSDTLKAQARTLNQDTTKLAIASTMGEEKLSGACSDLIRLDLDSSILALETSAFTPRGLSGAKKKIARVAELQKKMREASFDLEEKCRSTSFPITVASTRLQLIRDFRELMTFAQDFLLLVLDSK
jgi:hypothetical protein